MFAFIKVLILLQLIHLFLPNIAPSSVPMFSITNEKMDTNSSNITSGCQAKISESALKFMLELMRDKITHVIDIHIWIESANDTISKTRVPIRIKWANEIGRTLVSLIAQAEKLDYMMLQAYTITMKVGIHSMNIVVTEKAMRCFTSRHNTSDHDLFDLLVQQLHRITGSKAAYKLCLPHNDKSHVEKYNCCTVVGPNDALICSDYSSVVTEMSPILVWIFLAFILYISLPVAQEYLSQFGQSDEFYKIFNSPMSLSFILYLAFIEGHGPVKSLARKAIFSFFMVVTTLPEYRPIPIFIYVAFMIPLLLFLGIKKFYFYEKALFRGFNAIEIITFPINIPGVRKHISDLCRRQKRNYEPFDNVIQLDVLKTQENTETQPEPETPKNSQENTEAQQEPEPEFNFFIPFFILYLVSIPYLILRACAKLLSHSLNCVEEQVKSNSEGQQPEGRFNVKHVSLRIFIFITCGFIVYSIQNLFPLVLYFVFGLFLNGEFYSPYILPLGTMTFFSWTKWRSSVETKYLVLITNIYKVCKESKVENDECSNNATECFTIKLDDDGDPMIEKELYNLVRKKLLPYDRVLFHYFKGVFLIAIFAYILYILMSLAQTSDIPGSVQVIGTIAATSLPFIFDFVWKKKSDEQKEADSITLQSRIKRILRVHSSDDETGEIKVKFKDISATDKPKILKNSPNCPSTSSSVII